ncbi:cyclase family protein [Methanococcoides burtonii]|uniref:cyclase family protein n=1 Tax=Methanococcoides burtonii TaxID=29291 RepID=UPI0000398F0C|nr:cyclase family protein [Methanococcoides burtonii]
MEEDTPTYGNISKFWIEKRSSIKNGDIANNSSIHTTAHVGTHLDMPYHFYENGQTVIDFDPNFWIFNYILFFEIETEDIIIKNEILEILEEVENKEKYEMLIVKTGACNIRKEQKYWEENKGFSPEIADYLKKYFPNIRIFGFDSISVSSFVNRIVGREAHARFLDPSAPILLLEDMDLRQINKSTRINKVIVSPLRISQCDGLPCTVFAEVLDEN